MTRVVLLGFVVATLLAGCAGGDAPAAGPEGATPAESTPAESMPDESGSSPSGPLRSRILGTYEASVAALSPSGTLLFTATGDDPEITICVVDLEDGVSTRCLDGTLAEHFPDDSVLAPRWSPDERHVAWTQFTDVWAYDLAANRVVGVSDDGLLDAARDSIGRVPLDAMASWYNDEDLVFVRRPVDEPVVVLQVAGVDGAEGATTVGPADAATSRSVWEQAVYPPLVDSANGRVLVGGTGAVYDVVPGGEAAVLVDYAPDYEPVAASYLERVRVQVEPNLVPVSMTQGGAVVLWDPAIVAALNQGVWSGVPSGVFLARPGGDLGPVFAQSEDDGGYLAGSQIAVSPDGASLAFVWIDDSVRSDLNTGIPKLSIVDLEAELPVDVRSLPVLWSDPEGLVSAGPPIAAWSTNDRIIVRSGDGVQVLQLEAAG